MTVSVHFQHDSVQFSMTASVHFSITQHQGDNILQPITIEWGEASHYDSKCSLELDSKCLLQLDSVHFILAESVHFRVTVSVQCSMTGNVLFNWTENVHCSMTVSVCCNLTENICFAHHTVSR